MCINGKEHLRMIYFVVVVPAVAAAALVER